MPATWSSTHRRRPGGSGTTTSAPSTSCSRCSTPPPEPPLPCSREAGVDAAAVRDAVRRHLAQPADPLTAEDAEALRSIGIDLERVLGRLEETLGAGALAPSVRRAARAVPAPPCRSAATFPSPRRSKKVLELSLREAIALRHGHIGSEHILLGLIRDGRGSRGALVLVEQGVDLRALRAATLRALDQAA